MLFTVVPIVCGGLVLHQGGGGGGGGGVLGHIFEFQYF